MTASTRLRTVIALAAVGSTTACLPIAIPMEVQVAPAVSGVVYRGGSPEAGALVVYEQPNGKRVTATTDALGRFAFPEVKVGRLVVPTLGHCAHDWYVDVLADGVERGMRASVWTMCNARHSEMPLYCDLTVPDTFCHRTDQRFGVHLEEVPVPIAESDRDS